MPFKDRVVINFCFQCTDFNERSLFHSSKVIESKFTELNLCVHKAKQKGTKNLLNHVPLLQPIVREVPSHGFLSNEN